MRTTETAHLNRTGMSLAPTLAAELIEATNGTNPSSDGDAEMLATVRIAYAKDSDPIGSIPPPATMRAAAASAAKAILGDKMLVLVDKLGERLAFERSGTRLYDGLISKLDAYGSWDGGPSRADLQQIRNEEHEHFTLLAETVRELGGDPTAVTPSANVHAVASKGLCAVLSDPRTDLMQSMEAILTAELVDNDCWENLIDLARALGRDDVAARFHGPLLQEREHLAKVRHWLGVGLSRAATRKIDPAFVAREEERLLRTGAPVEAAAAAPSETASAAKKRRPAATKAQTKTKTKTKAPAARAKGPAARAKAPAARAKAARRPTAKPKRKTRAR
jgi:ferritin-like protein